MTDGSLSRPADFGPYTLLRELGRGGQGTVWLAEDQRLKRRVALKVLGTAPGALSEDRLSRFKREAEAAARLDDPHICALLDAGDVDGVPYLAFRYVEGETLAERIGRAFARREGIVERSGGETSEDVTTDPGSREGIQRIVRVFEKVARALHKAHERGLIHRDVKPGNIMITPDGNPVLLDFGLARDELAEELSLTHSGDLLGTPAYMSPEQLTAHRIPLDRRTDVYSLGATLYEALTLRKPFSAPTRAALYQQILTGEPSSVSSHNAQIPRDLQVVLETAMEKDRGRRYQTAADFAEDLRRFREFEPIQAKPIGAILRFRRWTQRHPARATAVVGAFAVLAVALGVALWFLGEVNRELVRRRALGLAHAAAEAGESDQSLALLLALRAVETQRLPETLAELHRAFGASYEERIIPAESPIASAELTRDGTRILTAHADGRVRLRDLDGADVLPPLVHPAPVLVASFRPDEKAVLTRCADGEVRIWDLSGRRIGGFSVGEASGAVARYSLEGDRILTSSDRTAELRDLDGRVVTTFEGHDGQISAGSFSADGRLVGTAADDDTVRIWDRRTGRAELVLHGHGHPDTAGAPSFSPVAERIVTAAQSGIARIWNRDGTLVATMPGHGGSVVGVQFSPDGSHVVTACADAIARMFDLDGKQVAAFRGHERFVNGAVFDGSGDHVLTWEGLGARLWQTRVPEAPVLRGHTDAVRSAVFAPDGRRLVTGGNDGVVRIWSADGRLEQTFDRGGVETVFYAEFSPDGRWIATADARAGTARILDLEGNEIARFPGHEVNVRTARFSPGGQRVLTTDADGAYAVWKVDGTLIRREQVDGAHGQFGSWSHAGDRIALTGDSGVLLLNDDGGAMRAIPSPARSISVVFTPDDRFVLAACADGVARLWAVDDPSAPVQSYRGHEAALLFAAVSPDGTRVLTASRDKTARLWDLETGRLITVLKGHTGIVWRCAFSPDGTRMATASWDHTARVWITDPDELVRLARARVIRDFTAAERERYGDLLGR